MINEAQVGNQAISNLQAGVTKEAPDEEMDNEFAMQYKNTAAAANIVGRRSMIRTLLLFLIQKAIANPITELLWMRSGGGRLTEEEGGQAGNQGRA